MVQPQHGGEVFFRQVRGGFHGDIGVGIGRVADHQHFHVALGDIVQRLALDLENLGIGGEQVAAFHAGAARARADEDGDIHILERHVRVVGGLQPATSGKAQSLSSMITPPRAFCACGRSSRLRMTGWSLPSRSPLAIRNRMA